jgi:hypothetical protein
VFFVFYLSADWVRDKQRERERERERTSHCELYRKKSGRREIAAVLATTRPGWCR